MAEKSLIGDFIDLSHWTYYDHVVNLREFKISIEAVLEANGSAYERETISSLGSISTIYKYTVLENKFISDDFFLNEILDNITYSVSSNFYFDTLTRPITDLEIVDTIKLINKRYNNSYVSVDELPFLNDSGYNLLNIIQPRHLNKVVVPVCRYDDKIFELLFVYKYKKNDGSISFRTCSVTINREDLCVYFFCNNSGGRFKTEEDDITQSEIISADTFYYFTKKLLTDQLNYDFEPHDSKAEKGLMFKFCNLLNKAMVQEFESELTRKIEAICNRQIKEIASTLGSQVTLDEITQNKIYKKIFSTYLGEYMVRLCDEKDLVLIAQDRNLPGYPTLINFVSSTASKGRTKTKNKNSPLTFEEVYYSLNTDFSENQELEEWRISWFESYFFDKAKLIDVSQTTIKITGNHFKVVNLNTIRRTKRMVLFIIGTIRDNLSKSIQII